MNQIHLNEDKLREAVEQSLMSAMRGMRDTANNAGMNIKNPADDYDVNFDEFNQKCQELHNVLQQYESYFTGNYEGDNNVRGLASTLELKAMWNGNQNERALANKIRKVGDLLHDVDYYVKELMEDCGNLKYQND